MLSTKLLESMSAGGSAEEAPRRARARARARKREREEQERCQGTRGNRQRGGGGRKARSAKREVRVPSEYECA